MLLRPVGRRAPFVRSPLASLNENHHCPNKFCCYVSHLFVEYWQMNPECTYIFHCCDERPCVNKFLKFLHTVSPSVTLPSVQPTTFPCGNSM